MDFDRCCTLQTQGVNAKMIVNLERHRTFSPMLGDRPLQFERPVDIDIDSQTGIQPRCIYMSRSPENICSRIRFMRRENVALECIGALCRVELVQKSSRGMRT